MSTISAVPMYTANLRKYRVLRYSIWVLEENAANSVYLCALRVHFCLIKCSETISPPVGFTPLPHIRSTHRLLLEYGLYKMPRYAPDGTMKHYFISIFRIKLLLENCIARNKVSR